MHSETTCAVRCVELGTAICSSSPRPGRAPDVPEGPAESPLLDAQHLSGSAIRSTRCVSAALWKGGGRGLRARGAPEGNALSAALDASMAWYVATPKPRRSRQVAQNPRSRPQNPRSLGPRVPATLPAPAPARVRPLAYTTLISPHSNTVRPLLGIRSPAQGSRPSRRTAQES